MHVFVFIVTELTCLIINSQVETEFYIFIMENSMKYFQKKRSHLMNLLIFLGDTEW